jgi:hypothetical protein
MIAKQDRRPDLYEMPFDVIGEHAQKDVSADALFRPMPDRAS